MPDKRKHKRRTHSKTKNDKEITLAPKDINDYDTNKVTTILQQEQFFYSLDIKLPEKMKGDITDYSDLENHDLIISSSKSFNNMLPADFTLYDSILQYIKYEWDYANKLYNYCNWPTVDENMLELSERYPDCKFILYCKGEFFIDTYVVKIYINGSLEYSGSNVSCHISIILPDGSVKETNNAGVVMLENGIDKMFMTKNKSINVKEQINVATNLLAELGQSVVNVGSAFTETILASKLLSACFTIVEIMNQDYTLYGYNKDKCYYLNLRCKSILTVLQNIPPSSLNLACVINVVNVIKNAIDLINKYNSMWRITKFIESSTYTYLFNTANLNLSNFYYDLGLNYTINKKNFEIKSTIKNQ